MNIKCFTFGHQWVLFQNEGVHRCMRCGKTSPLSKRQQRQREVALDADAFLQEQEQAAIELAVQQVPVVIPPNLPSALKKYQEIREQRVIGRK